MGSEDSPQGKDLFLATSALKTYLSSDIEFSRVLDLGLLPAQP